MNGQSLANILTLLRKIKATQNNMGVQAFINELAGQQTSETAALKICAYLIEQIDQAQVVIENLQISQEAKEGVQSATEKLLETFSLKNIAGDISRVRNMAGQYISNFVILLSAYGIPESVDIKPSAADLISDIEEAISLFGDEDIDPSVRLVAIDHLKILLLLLKNVDLLGLEPALSEYFSAMMKIRRADIGSGSKAHAKMKPIWDRLESWGERLGTLDKIVNSGAKLIENGSKVTDLLQHFGN